MASLLTLTLTGFEESPGFVNVALQNRHSRALSGFSLPHIGQFILSVPPIHTVIFSIMPCKNSRYRSQSYYIPLCNIIQKFLRNTYCGRNELLFSVWLFYSMLSLSKSGRDFFVRSSACCFRHLAIFAWSPLRRISGTFMSRKTSGLVYWGYSKSP